MKVRITRNDFVIGSVRIPEGSIIELPPVAVDYLVLQGRGERVQENPVPRETTAMKKRYERQDMLPEKIPSPPGESSSVEHKPPKRKVRTYQRRDQKRTHETG